MSRSVLVADDHPLFRSALAEMVERTPDMTLAGTAGTLDEAIALLQSVPCNLALLDWQMPGMDGMDGIRRIRAEWPGLRIALISGNLTSGLMTDGLKAGITGFLAKDFNQEVIVAALNLILSGAIYVPHELAAAAALSQQGRSEEVEGGALTRRELEILGHIVAGSTNKVIGRALGIAEVTVKLHTQRIVRKLGVKNRAAAIAKAVREGLVANEP